MSTDVDFYFDPRCPWAWITSRWITDLETQGVVKVNWKIMSLARLHEDADDYDAQRFETVRIGTRAAAAAASVKGDDILGPIYTVLGRRIHQDKQTYDRSLVEATFAELDLPADLVDSVFTTEYDDAIAKTHDEAVALAGTDLGTPVIAYNGKAFFGPVLRSALTGADARKVWDAMVLLAEVEGVYEIKRDRAAGLVV